MVMKDTFFFQSPIGGADSGLGTVTRNQARGVYHQSHPQDGECKTTLVRPGANQTYGDGIGQKSANSQ